MIVIANFKSTEYREGTQISKVPNKVPVIHDFFREGIDIDIGIFKVLKISHHEKHFYFLCPYFMVNFRLHQICKESLKMLSIIEFQA